MLFYNRRAELEVLNSAVHQKCAAMIIISGRRRVGKSRLVDEFLKGNDAYRIFAVPKEEKLVAADFAEALSDQYKPTFGSVRDALDYFFAKSGKRILYIDEFPNLLDANASIPFELQKMWEQYKSSTNKILILSGSYVRMMDKIFTKRKAPLFNRATFKLLLDPLKQGVIWDIQKKELHINDPIRNIANYCIFGGIPYYYEVLEKHKTTESAVDLFFNVGQLRDEGQDILRQEFGSAYKKYFSILESIGYGTVSAGEIGNRIGIRQTTLSKYLIALQNDFKLVRREVPFGQNPHRSKKGIYALNDNLLAFWFNLVYGKDSAPGKAELDRFISKRFELLCMDFMVNVLAIRKEKVLRRGRWWGNIQIEGNKYEPREIDLVIESDKALYVGECKWSEKKIGMGELQHLKQSATALKTNKPTRWVLFNKGGFDIGESKDILLFDPQKIVNGRR